MSLFKTMKITDLNGREIAVANLDLAILQADDFRHYRLSREHNREFSDRQQAYWEDIYQQLLLLLEKEQKD